MSVAVIKTAPRYLDFGLTAKMLVCGMAYFLLGIIGLSLAYSSPGTIPIWSPIGIGMAAIILYGYRLWPGIFFGALASDWAATQNLSLSLLMALGQVTECVLGAWFVNRFAGGRRFYQRPWDVIKFVLLAAMFSPLLSPPIGVRFPNLELFIFWAGRTYDWLSCWLGEVVSVVALVPLILVWQEDRTLRFNRLELLEFALLNGLLVLVAGAVFGQLPSTSFQMYLLPNLCLPFLIWSAFRFGPRETITANFLLGGIALWGTMHGHGYFSLTDPDEALLIYQVFLASNSVIALAVAAAIRQRNQSRQELRAARDGLELRVQERTAELSQANAELQTEMQQREAAQKAHSVALRQLVQAQETERARISRELHDQLGQEITALKLALKMLQQRLTAAGSPPAGTERLEESANRLMANVHRLAWELRPAILDDFGLEMALRRYTSEWAERASLTLDYHCDPPVGARLAPTVETMLFRITQEALTNVVRHARATRVSVLLKHRPDHVLLIIEDDGCGFELESVLSGQGQRSLGLLGMQERVLLVGGILNIETAPGQGTTLFVRVPLAVSKIMA